MRKFDNVEKVRLTKEGLRAVEAKFYDKKDVPKGVGRIVTYDDHDAPEVGIEWAGAFLYVSEDLLEAVGEEEPEVKKTVPAPSEFEAGDIVRLSKSGRKHVKRTYKGAVKESPVDFPLDGQLGRILFVESMDDRDYPGMAYVDWPGYADYLDDEHLLGVDEMEFPVKLRAYEVRIGDVIKDDQGLKFPVDSIIDYDGVPAVLEFSESDYNNDDVATRSVGATDKVKVYSRRYQ